jgi:K+-sensing histidine kinase KdpD
MMETNDLANDAFNIVAHEMRSHLNAILGWARLLHSARLDEEARARAAKAVERNAEEHARLVEGLLEVARVASGAARPRTLAVEIAPVVGSALDAVRGAAGGKGVRLHVVRDEAAGPVAGDYDCVQYVVRSLLNTAVAVAPDGSSLNVAIACAGPHVEISATHTGGDGAEGDPSGALGGAGRQREFVQLAIARRLAEAHGGSICVASAEGGGCTLTASLPAAPPARASEPEALARQAGPADDSRPKLNGMRVLIFSGESERRSLVAAVLAAFNAEVRTANSFEDAIRAVGDWAREC